MERRELLCLLPNVLCLTLAGCTALHSPLTPSTMLPLQGKTSRRATFSAILTQAGYVVTPEPVEGHPGTARIALNGDASWQFKINGELFGIVSDREAKPTLNMPDVILSEGTVWEIQK